MLIVVSLFVGESYMGELALPSSDMKSPAVRGKYQDASV
jgi:hypothetical protein